MGTELSDHANIMLTIMRTAAKRQLFPTPFTGDVIQVILDALQLSDEEYQQTVEILKADVRESAATTGNLGNINDKLKGIN